MKAHLVPCAERPRRQSCFRVCIFVWCPMGMMIQPAPDAGGRWIGIPGCPSKPGIKFALFGRSLPRDGQIRPPEQSNGASSSRDTRHDRLANRTETDKHDPACTDPNSKDCVHDVIIEQAGDSEHKARAQDNPSGPDDTNRPFKLKFPSFPLGRVQSLFGGRVPSTLRRAEGGIIRWRLLGFGGVGGPWAQIIRWPGKHAAARALDRIRSQRFRRFQLFPALSTRPLNHALPLHLLVAFLI